MFTATPKAPALRLIVTPRACDGGAGPRVRLDPAAIFLLVTALVPIAGYAILGRWSERELGVAAALAAVALWCLADPD